MSWTRIGMRHHHGICLPLFSLKARHESAIGEYLDLIPIINWCKDIGFDIIQLLPLNDSGGDSSPYSAHTAMGLHPIYLSLSQLPYLDTCNHLQAESARFHTDFPSKKVAYLSVLEKKLAFLRSYAKKTLPIFTKTNEYQLFKKNSWVKEYAHYKTTKKKNNEAPWWQWQECILDPDEEAFHTLCQFLCFQQWKKVKAHADRAKVFLKGDIPILINRDSSDVWHHRELFLLEYEAGAPPDMYSQEGQQWGFPLYNWPVLSERGYDWWIRRLQLAEKLYHLFRLDHIVGFYKIWAIPQGKSAKEGFFLPQDESQWIEHGETILRALLHECHMLPIGEDLGAVPPAVRASLQRLKIAGTKVLRWERRWEGDRSFINPKQLEPLSMSTLSTHDSEPVALWWQEQPTEARDYAQYLQVEYETPLKKTVRQRILEECHKSSSLFHINLLQEYLGMFDELAWPDPKDDRINVPGTVSDENWTYRFKPTISEFTAHEPLRALMRKLSS